MSMEPLIVQKPEIKLIGMSFYGDPFDTRGGWDAENEIGRVWTRFTQYLKLNGEGIQYIVTPGVFYEVHIYNDETATKGNFEVFVGVPIDHIEAIPVELLVKILPPTAYAVFTFQGDAIASDWNMQIGQWLSDAGYRRAHPFSFQYYDDRFKGVDKISESILDVYMPVEPVG